MSGIKNLTLKFKLCCNEFLNVTIRNVCSSFSKSKGKGYVCKDLDDGYKPSVVETERSKVWGTDGRFIYKPNGKFNFNEEKVFSMILPPPNVTGNLHLGHALTTTIQDVIARWKRMSGYKVMFLPGMDHAGIATQVVVEKYLAKKGITKHELGKEKFVKEVWKWKENHGNTIRDQLKRLGASLDWSRELFTMDEKHVENVKLSLFELNKKNLFHRHTRLINWSVALGSTISDIEMDTIEIDGPTTVKLPGYPEGVEFGHLTYIAYPLVDSDGEIVVATTRPETILGDVAIAVNPLDPRYIGFHGRLVRHPLLPGVTLPVVEDTHVQINFGAGAVKITPAHNRDDFIVARKHDLPVKLVIDETGCIVGSFKYARMPRYVAREKIVNDLKVAGHLRDKVPHKMSLPTCSRTGDIVEILPRDQWFLECKDLNRSVKELSDGGELEIIPKNHRTVWNKWLTDEREWCLSRQLWWGIDFPIWEIYPKDKPELSVFVKGMQREEALKYAVERFQCDVQDVVCEQDRDVMDTWFSSGTYPFTALGWPKDTTDYKELYPLSLMVTGHDIMGLWVMRMAMLGLALTDKLPFPKVLLHGIITDARGAKMSKSKGNVINPIDVINGATLEELDAKSKTLFDMGTLNESELKLAMDEHKKCYPKGIPECGADALRLTLCEVNPKNQAISFNVDKCHTNKLFCNKVWQSVRFYKNCHNLSVTHDALDKCTRDHLQKIDIWLLSRLHLLVCRVNNSLEKYDFHLAVDALKTFLYEDMCDRYIECTKHTLKSDLTDEANAIKLAAHCHVFSACYGAALRCLAPFMPFLTDELIQAIPAKENIIHNFEDTLDNLVFPEAKDYAVWKNETIDEQFDTCMNIISCIRKLRQTFNIDYKFKPKIVIKDEESYIFDVLANFRDVILFITKCESIDVDYSYKKSSMDVWSYMVDDDCELYLEVPQTKEYVEKFNAAKEKLLKKREKLLKSLSKLQKLHVEQKNSDEPLDPSDENLIKIKEIQEDLRKISYLEKSQVVN